MSLYQSAVLRSVAYLLLFTSQPLLSSSSQKCRLRGLSGIHHDQICTILNQFKALAATQDYVEVTLRGNSVLFHGTPGNGKSTKAKKVAQLSGRKFIELDAASIVEAYPGKGGQKIIALLEHIKSIVESTGKGVVIFIDEIEVLAANIDTEFRAEHKATLAKLWLMLDKYASDNDVLFIFATNNIKKISRTFLGRFREENIIEMAKPDDNNRKEMIADFVSGTLPVLDETALDRNVHHLIMGYAQEMQNPVDSIHRIAQQHYMTLTDQADKNNISSSMHALEFATKEAVVSVENISEYASLEDMRKVYTDSFGHVVTCLETLSKQFTDSKLANETVVQKIGFVQEFEKTSRQALQLISIINEKLRQVDTAIAAIDENNKQFSLQEKNGIEAIIAEIEASKLQFSSLHSAINSKKIIHRVNGYTSSFGRFLDETKAFLSVKNIFLIDALSNDVLSALVEATGGLSNRELENFKEQIQKVMTESNQDCRQDMIKDLNVRISKVLAMSKKISTSEDHEELRVLAAKFEAMRAYKHFECGDNPTPECLKAIKKESKYDQLKAEYKAIFKQ